MPLRVALYRLGKVSIQELKGVVAFLYLTRQTRVGGHNGEERAVYPVGALVMSMCIYPVRSAMYKRDKTHLWYDNVLLAPSFHSARITSARGPIFTPISMFVLNVR